MMIMNAIGCRLQLKWYWRSWHYQLNHSHSQSNTCPQKKKRNYREYICLHIQLRILGVYNGTGTQYIHVFSFLQYVLKYIAVLLKSFPAIQDKLASWNRYTHLHTPYQSLCWSKHLTSPTPPPQNTHPRLLIMIIIFLFYFIFPSVHGDAFFHLKDNFSLLSLGTAFDCVFEETMRKRMLEGSGY